MANEEPRSQLRFALGWGASNLAAGAYLAGPICVLLGLVRHETFIMGYALAGLAVFQAVGAIWMIFDPDLGPSPRDPPFILAMTAVGLTPVLLFLVWPGDPFAFPVVAAITVASYVVMPAAQVTAFFLKRPPPAARPVLLVAGVAACLAFLAAYAGLLLAMGWSGASAPLHPQAIRTTLLLSAPAVPFFLIAGAVLVSALVRPPASP